MSIRPWAARKALLRLTAASLMLAAMAATTLSGTAAADQNSGWFGFPTGGHNPGDNPGLCPGQITPNALPQGGGNAPGQVDDLAVLDGCHDTINTGGTYYFGQINIAGGGASLSITEPTTGNKNIIIWASSIIVENGGTLQAGTAADPYGNNGGTLTIYIYGKDLSGGKDPAANQGQGVLCHGKLDITKQTGPCGIPWKVWSDNGESPTGLDGSPTVGGVKDYFYQYGPLYGDGLCSDGKTLWDPKDQCNNKTNARNQAGYFGYKVLAVSYGGSLQLFGYKGTTLVTAPQKIPKHSFRLPLSSKTEQGGHDVTNSFKNAPSGDTQNGSNFLRFFGFFRQPPGGQNGGGNGSGGGNGLGSGNPLDPDKGPACAQSDPDKHPLSTGCSWLRLVGDLQTTANTLTLSSEVGDKWWKTGDVGDQMVVTTTDYLPGHSELLTIDSVSKDTVTFHTDGATKKPLWFHSGMRYQISKILGTNSTRFTKAGMDADLIKDGPETRAAVALLTRSIRIISAGDEPKDDFDKSSSDAAQCQGLVKDEEHPPTCYSFGAHMVFRQGFKAVQIQGVEFKNMGQPGKPGHYPIHFHMARLVPTGTFVKDSSINESMTRWIVLHSTQGVLLQRNVGYKSIGHGFFLEDGTETGNKLYSNLGIFARAAVDNAQNPRKVPGILADSQSQWAPGLAPPNSANPGFPFRADAEFPTAFWITNGWNEFVGNMAAGTGACGSGYWFVPTINSDMPEVPTAANSEMETVRPNVMFMHMRWNYIDKDKPEDTTKFGYAGLQRNTTFEASTPLKVFYGNSSTATMMSFQTTTDAPACDGFLPAATVTYPPPAKKPVLLEIKSFAPPPGRITIDGLNQADLILPGRYYPRTHGLRAATLCDASSGEPDCSRVKDRCSVADGTNCTVTVLDHFTSSFTWAHGNVSAIWLRPQWYLLTNSVITDVQNGGVTFITGGDFTHSAVIPGYWGLMLDSILVGHTQPQDDAHKFALDLGPVNTASGLTCKEVGNGEVIPGHCVVPREGVSFPVVSYFVNQKLSNIYDGPSYQDSNIYLDISPTKCTVDNYNKGGCIYGSRVASGIPKDPVDGSCYLPNAAIGWKQPNGFFYPPAFHSTNLFFGKVGIRHYVIKPIFKASAALDDLDPKQDFGQGGTYITSSVSILDKLYCTQSENMFNGYTSIDRQTELNDADGTLTGLSNDVTPSETLPAALKQTISVNEDAFFTAPVETPECATNDGNTPTSATNVLPANACKSPSTKAPPVTAKTSPYDYVATVVFHKVDPADNWDSVCSNPQCYGVPLYRQYLAGDKATKTREWAHWHESGCDNPPTTASLNNPKCRWPFIRMAGEDSLGTRETLTVNNGLYYLDTAVPLNMQKDIYKRDDPRPPIKVSSGENYNQQAGPQASLDNAGNVFQPNGTYYMFFLYAKNSTRQTYQIYVGKDPKGGSVKPARVQIPNTTLVATQDGDTQPWVIPDTSTVMTDGIVSVTVDFSKLPKDSKTQKTELDPVPDNGLCKPSKFCTADGIKCGSKLDDKDPAILISTNLKDNAARACSTWAVKDLDCPTKGCLGFSFTLPDATIFVADATVTNPTPHRRQPIAFGEDTDKTAQGLPNWFVKFAGTAVDPDHTAGQQCHYSKLPSYVDSSTECLTPDWVPQAPK